MPGILGVNIVSYKGGFLPPPRVPLFAPHEETREDGGYAPLNQSAENDRELQVT